MEFCMHCMVPLAEEARFCPACGKAQSYDCPPHHLQPGTLLSGRYLLGVALGEGGFGITYIARDIRLGMTVAVKEFYPTGYVSRNAVHSQTVTAVTRGREFFEKGKRKFLDEAHLLAELHEEPGIVDVRDFFEENNTAYIVMEYLKGETLRTRLKRVGRLPFPLAYSMLRPVMESLMAAHKKNVVHRDIAPDNIMLTRRGAKLLDFGAAREVFSADEHSLSIMVKRGYSPLEQYTKKNQGPWTDVYALCATLYRCVTGTAPGDPLLRSQQPLRPLASFGVNVPPGVEAALAKGLEPYPDRRYQSVQELLTALNKALRTPQPVVSDRTDRLPQNHQPRPTVPKTVSNPRPTVSNPRPSTPRPTGAAPRPLPVQKAPRGSNDEARASLPRPADDAKPHRDDRKEEEKPDDAAKTDDALMDALENLKNDPAPDDEKPGVLRYFFMLLGIGAVAAAIIISFLSAHFN
ncbi:MAG: protein kinase [Clostridia bacterium]|nr:protein kinase [Clostridia bacterium]